MFHSEQGQDRWLAEGVFAGKRDGVFVEFGALDGVLHSNSLYFEREIGWRGLLIEANPACVKPLRENRPQTEAVWAAVWDGLPGSLEFEAFGGSLFGWSGVMEAFEPQHSERVHKRIPGFLRETVQVPCAPLEIILGSRDMLHIDYLSADCEGAEERIFAAFPFDKFDVDVIGCENNWGNDRLDAIFEKAGYRKIGRVGVDDFWRRTQ